MLIGYSEVDITPPVGVELCGYGYYPGRISTGIHDPLFVRAISFSEGEKRLLLLNCDLLTVSRKILDEVKQNLKKDLGLRKEDILILSTHTHTGPNASDTEGIGERDENYCRALPALLIKAGHEAFKSMRQVKQAKKLEAELDGKVGYNRTSPKGPVDNRLRAAAFYFEEGKPLAVLSYGCHPVTLGPSSEISADYPGSVVKKMKKAGYNSLFLTAFCGDIDPVSNILRWGSGTGETIDQYGDIITGTFLKKIQEGMIAADLSIESFEMDIKLDTVRLTGTDIDNFLKDSIGEKDRDPGKYKLMQLWTSRMKENIKSGRNPYERLLSVQAFKAGSILMAGFPAEMFTDLARPLREAFPGMTVMALGNANATVGYIATHNDIESGGYAGFESSFLYMTLPLKAGEGERLAGEAAAGLRAKIDCTAENNF